MTRLALPALLLALLAPAPALAQDPEPVETPAPVEEVVAPPEAEAPEETPPEEPEEAAEPVEEDWRYAGPRYPDAAPYAPSQAVQEAFSVAASYWRAQGLGLDCPKGLRFYLAPNLQEWDSTGRSAARAMLGGCTVWLRTDYLATITTAAPDAWTTAWRRRELCRIATHEMGHLLGFGHEDGGRYAIVADVTDVMPAECSAAWPAPVPAQTATASVPAPLSFLTIRHARRKARDGDLGRYSGGRVKGCSRKAETKVRCRIVKKVRKRGARRQCVTRVVVWVDRFGFVEARMDGRQRCRKVGRR